MKEGISLGFEDGPGRGWLPDGSRMTWLNALSGKKADRLPVRAAEHNVTMPSGHGEEQVSQTCTMPCCRTSGNAQIIQTRDHLLRFAAR